MSVRGLCSMMSDGSCGRRGGHLPDPGGGVLPGEAGGVRGEAARQKGPHGASHVLTSRFDCDAVAASLQMAPRCCSCMSAIYCDAVAAIHQMAPCCCSRMSAQHRCPAIATAGQHRCKRVALQADIHASTADVQALQSGVLKTFWISCLRRLPIRRVLMHMSQRHHNPCMTARAWSSISISIQKS